VLKMQNGIFRRLADIASKGGNGAKRVGG
jgi:hypothetical protein